MADVLDVYREFMKDSYNAMQDAHKAGIDVGTKLERKRILGFLEQVKKSGTKEITLDDFMEFVEQGKN